MKTYCVMIDSIFEGIEGRSCTEVQALCDSDARQIAIASIVGDITHIDSVEMYDHDELIEDLTRDLDDEMFDLRNGLPF